MLTNLTYLVFTLAAIYAGLLTTATITTRCKVGSKDKCRDISCNFLNVDKGCWLDERRAKMYGGEDKLRKMRVKLLCILSTGVALNVFGLFF